MQFDVYRAPFSCYPRCQYAHKHSKQLCDRYELYLTDEQLRKECIPVLADPSGRISDGNPDFYVCLQKLETLDKVRTLEINDVLKRNEGSSFIETITCERLRYLSMTYSYLKEKYVIIITAVSVNEGDFPQGDNVQTIEVTEHIEDGDKVLESRRVSQNFHISLKEDISDQVSNLMEQNIFKAFKMKTKCENLLTTLDNIYKHDAWQENNILPNVEEQTYHNKQHVERMERLYGEIKGMFTRSRVPKDEQPQFDNRFDGIVNDKLKEDLRQFSSSIKSCGFHLRSVLVFVEDNCDQEKLKPGIERVLKKHNIHTFSIVSSKVRELSSCNVGSEVAANVDGTFQYGTLGGFARASSDEGNKTICLVSRHVVTNSNGDPASELKVLNDGNAIDASIMVDKSIKDRRKNVLDIAAASFEGDERQFDTKYKTSEEKAATGRLSDYGLDDLKGLPVHICGSKTSKGYGTITVPRVEGVQDSSMNDFMIIEDRENSRDGKVPFCKKGDSGAIVCADDQDNPDNVQLISMVIGEDTQKIGSYYCLNLEEGVKQVKEEIKAKNIQLL